MYLQSYREFIIRTDNMTVRHLQNLKYGKSKVRWSVFLDQFNFKIVHIAGEKNSVADAISRREFDPVEDDNKTIVGDGIDMDAYIANIEPILISNDFVDELSFHPKQLEKSKARHRKRHSQTICIAAVEPPIASHLNDDEQSNENDEAEEPTNREIATQFDEVIPEIDLKSQSDDIFNCVLFISCLRTCNTSHVTNISYIGLY